MDYQKIYNQLIDRSRDRVLVGYVERHHIIPKSMGGTDRKSNIAILTAREHFVAHMLLWKMHKTGNMASAVWFLSFINGKKISSKLFEKLRIEHAALVSGIHRNKIVSEETKLLIGKSSKGRKSAMKGKSFNLSEDEIKRRSDLRKGKNLGNPGWPGERSEEYKQKCSTVRIGHKPYNFKRVSINGVEYESAAEAARTIGISYNSIIRRIREEKYTEYFYL